MTDLILKQEFNVYGNISSSEKTVICKGCGAVLSEDLKCRYCGNEYIDKNKKDERNDNHFTEEELRHARLMCKLLSTL